MCFFAFFSFFCSSCCTRILCSSFPMESIIEGASLRSSIAARPAAEWTGASLEELVERSLQDPSVFVFGELIALPGFQSLPPRHAATVRLFAFGTLLDHNPESHLPLSPALHSKLAKLSAISLVLRTGAVPISFEALAQATGSMFIQFYLMDYHFSFMICHGDLSHILNLFIGRSNRKTA